MFGRGMLVVGVGLLLVLGVTRIAGSSTAPLSQAVGAARSGPYTHTPTPYPSHTPRPTPTPRHTPTPTPSMTPRPSPAPSSTPVPTPKPPAPTATPVPGIGFPITGHPPN